jgi:hypothetical protein
MNNMCQCGENCKCETESYVGGNPFADKISTTGTSFSNTAYNTTTINLNGLDYGSSTSINTWDMYHPKELKDVKITSETIEIIYVERAKYSYTTTNITINGGYTVHNPDRTVKEIYGTREGRLCLLKTVYGRVIPPQEIPETYEFDE